MTKREAQTWLVSASLLLTATTWVFFLAAPALGYPLTYAEAIALLKQITPVFVGYLGLAVGFLSTAKDQGTPGLGPLAPLFTPLVRGPVLLYGTVMANALVVFCYST